MRTATPKHLLEAPVIKTFTNKEGNDYLMVVCESSNQRCWIPNGLNFDIQETIELKPKNAVVFYIREAVKDDSGVWSQEHTWLDADGNDLF